MSTFLLAALVFLSTSLTVVVTYFSPFGVERGVGPGVVVEQFNDSGESERFCITGSTSQCTIFGIPSPSHVLVEAYYQDPNPWYDFECKRGKSLDMPEEYLLVQCRRVMRIPFLSGGE